MPMWVKIDAILCLSIAFLLKAIGKAGLFLLGVSYLGLVTWGVFEYGEGIHDLSTLEVVSLLIFSALIYRHYKYSKRFQSSIWSAISRPLYAFGWLALLLATPTIIYVVIQSELGRPYNIFETSELKLFEWFLNIFVLYLSAPCDFAQINKKASSDQKTNRVEGQDKGGSGETPAVTSESGAEK